MSQRAWTDEDFGFLADHPDWTARDVAEKLGRTVATVYQYRHKIRHGWSPSGAERWTESEDDVIRATPNLTARQVAERLPGRTKDGVEWRRKALAANDPSLNFGDYSSRNKDPLRIGGRRLIAKTCRKCGLLLDGSWFYSKDGRGWRSKCARCHQVGNARPWHTQDVGQKLTIPLASNHGAPWLESDDAVLKDPTLTLTEKAIRLGRTYRAVSTRCCVLGYVSDARRTDRTQPENVQWRIHAPNAEDALWEAS